MQDLRYWTKQEKRDALKKIEALFKDVLDVLPEEKTVLGDNRNQIKIEKISISSNTNSFYNNNTVQIDQLTNVSAQTSKENAFLRNLKKHKNSTLQFTYFLEFIDKKLKFVDNDYRSRDKKDLLFRRNAIKIIQTAFIKKELHLFPPNSKHATIDCIFPEYGSSAQFDFNPYEMEHYMNLWECADKETLSSESWNDINKICSNYPHWSNENLKAKVKVLVHIILKNRYKLVEKGKDIYILEANTIERRSEFNTLSKIWEGWYKGNLNEKKELLDRIKKTYGVTWEDFLIKHRFIKESYEDLGIQLPYFFKYLDELTLNNLRLVVEGIFQQAMNCNEEQLRSLIFTNLAILLADESYFKVGIKNQESDSYVTLPKVKALYDAVRSVEKLLPEKENNHDNDVEMKELENGNGKENEEATFKKDFELISKMEFSSLSQQGTQAIKNNSFISNITITNSPQKPEDNEANSTSTFKF